jgi:membrane-associated phospholipid phosphatase
MTAQKLLLLASLAAALPLRAEANDRGPEHRRGQIEPHAGQWRTWVISSGRDYRVPPPPTPWQTRAELRRLEQLTRHLDDPSRQKIVFWDAGAPAYRWIDLISARLFAGTPTSAYPHRVYTYVALAMYDATVATWESKYHYRRPRPSLVDDDVRAALAVPDSPSYPSEHAAAAQAAATVLAHFLPAEAASFQAMAEEAGWSRVQAGLQYPSDYHAGLALGRRVAEEVITQADADGSSAVWTGSVPTGPCNWVGTNPGNVAAAGWNPLLLTSPQQFRPPVPPDCHSPQVTAEKEVVRTFPRTFVTNYKAFFWQSPDGLNLWPYRYLNQWLFEDGLDRNPPRAARAYALVAAVLFDAFIASQDGKFAYWYIRPHQLDPAIVPLFPVPNFPSYPSNHSTFSTARAEVLAYLFPTRADFIRAIGKEGGDSRIWAGIHYPMDNVAGVNLGKSVAEVFIDWAEDDGSH